MVRFGLFLCICHTSKYVRARAARIASMCTNMNKIQANDTPTDFIVNVCPHVKCGHERNKRQKDCKRYDCYAEHVDVFIHFHLLLYDFVCFFNHSRFLLGDYVCSEMRRTGEMMNEIMHCFGILKKKKLFFFVYFFKS